MQQKEQNTLDFSLNEEQLAIRDTCREFAQQEIKPLAEEMDRTGAFPYKLIRKMAELGLLGLPFPEEYGGAGATITAVTGMQPDGCKEITNIIVPKGTPGYIIGNPYKKMGWKASDTRPLIFEDCVIPENDILGQRGDGFRQFMQILDAGRVAIAALSVGLAQACLDEGLSYANERKQFGQPISKFQVTQFKLADMDTEIELARLMYQKAAWLQMQGEPYSREASMAKLFASETAKRAADQAVQIHGGYGFMDEYPVSRYWRSVKVNEIGEGTSEVQRMVIAKYLGC